MSHTPDKESWTPEPWKSDISYKHTGRGTAETVSVQLLLHHDGEVVCRFEQAENEVDAQRVEANLNRIRNCVNACAGLTPMTSEGQSVFRECVEALEAQHKAIDWLFAQLIEANKDFYPSQSPVWPVMLQGNQALIHAQEQR